MQINPPRWKQSLLAGFTTAASVTLVHRNFGQWISFNEDLRLNWIKNVPLLRRGGGAVGVAEMCP